MPEKKQSVFVFDPLQLAIFLSLITFVLSWLWGKNATPDFNGFVKVLGFWEKGFWDLLAFSMQMVLILFLGYMLAISPAFDKLAKVLSRFAEKPVQAMLVISISALILGLINWGLALVFGAVLVRKTGEQAQKLNLVIPYGLMGAAAYSCMMIWHSGFSGSAPLSVASAGHFLEMKTGIITLRESILSEMNISAVVLLAITLPLLGIFLLKKAKSAVPEGLISISENEKPKQESIKKSSIKLLQFFGAFIVITAFINAFIVSEKHEFGLNQVNFVLLGLVFLFSGNMNHFQKNAATAIKSTSGIVIQFPIYAGIMGMLNYSGLLAAFTFWLSGIATAETFPIITLISASIVNFFVPSGGGQWAVQGPVIMETAALLGVSLPKAVMALAYGDQLTNMLQPFWALPLLGITGLKASELLRYTIYYLLVGLIIFSLVLILF
jgi:short-chain fatty acids transporter